MLFTPHHVRLGLYVYSLTVIFGGDEMLGEEMAQALLDQNRELASRRLAGFASDKRPNSALTAAHYELADDGVLRPNGQG